MKNIQINFKNKVAIVCGGSSGIGKSISLELLKNQCYVIIISSNANKLNKLKNFFSKKKISNYDLLNSDLTNFDNLKEVYNRIKIKFKKIDFLINVVGYSSIEKSTHIETQIKYIDKSYRLNLYSTIAINKYLIKLLNKKGSVICIGSIAGVKNLPAPLEYSVFKSALVRYVRSMSCLLKSDQRINLINPGNIYVRGGLWDKKLKKNPKTIYKYIDNNVPMKRFGDLSDITNLVLFLISDYSSFITGQYINVDGGQSVK